MVNIKKKSQFFAIISLILFILFFLIIAFCIFTIIGIGFLSFLGFEYDSFKSVIFFFAIYFCIGGPIDLICTSLLDVIRYINRLPYISYKFLEAFFDISLTFVIVNIIDVFIRTITIPKHTEILFAILSYAFSQCMDFMDKDKDKDTLTK